MLTRIALLALSSLFVTPAVAHPGNHGSMSFFAVVQHYAEPDHLALLALTIIVGVVSYRWGRRIEARARVNAKKQEGGRS